MDRTPAERLGAFAPLNFQHREVRQQLLAGASLQRGGLARAATRLAGDVEPLGDLVGALGELAQQPTGNPGDLGRVVVHRPPLDTEPLAQLSAHRSLKQNPNRTLSLVQRSPIERSPSPVDPTRRVRNQDMPVQVRVAHP